MTKTKPKAETNERPSSWGQLDPTKQTIQRAYPVDACISIKLCRDGRLSSDGRSLGFFLASLQEGEQISLADIAKTLHLSLKRITAAHEELQAVGYAKANGDFNDRGAK